VKSLKNKILHKTVSGVAHFYSSKSKYLSKDVPIEVARLFPSSSFNMVHKIHNKIKDEITKQST